MDNSRSWRDPSRYIQKIHVEEPCLDFPYTKEILARAGLPWSVVGEGKYPDIGTGIFVEDLTVGKQHLFLSMNKGRFFKACPGTREYRCCNYYVLNTGMNCPIDCVYCILQAYLNNPWLSYYVNVDQMTAEIGTALSDNPDRKFRIGTGEFTDSLAIDRLTGLSRKLVSYIATCPNAVLELKTKSGMIDNLADLDHQGRTIIAWSLNSSEIMQKEELRSATFQERLAAARQCVEWGYKLAFHFDPIIVHDGWEKGYAETIDALYRLIPAAAIAWISLGALRFLPKLKDIATHRFPGSQIYYQEFVDGLDGKSRYFRFNRVKLYQHIYQELRKHAADSTCIYFCMESDEIWREVMGFIPEERGGISAMLDTSVFS